MYREIKPQKGTGAPRAPLTCHCEERSDVAISQYTVGSWGSLRRNRSCLPEIAPQGHFLALRAQGATSACGLLAMTKRGPLSFYRYPIRIGSIAPGPAVPSPTARKQLPCTTPDFRQNVFDISGAGGYNKDVETQTVATNITYLFPICEFRHSQISESSGCDRRLTFFLSEANRRSGRDDNGYSNTPVSPGVFVIRQYTASVPCRPFNGRRVRYIPGTP